MTPLNLLLDFLVTSLISGLIATGVMSLFVYITHLAGVSSAGIIQTVGSTVTGSLNKSATPIGIMIHFIAGIAFAMMYTVLFLMTPLKDLSPSLYPVISATIGAAHGFVVFFILVPLLAENHPISSVREEGTGIALVYFFAHILFGLVLGFCLAASPLFSL